MTKKESKKLFAKTYFYNDTFSMFYHFTDSKKEFIDMSSWMGVPTPDNVDGRCVQASNGSEIRILIGVFNNDLSTLVHEAMHASLYTLDSIGQKLSYDDEVIPYLASYIFRECRKKMTT